ncbi:MAG: peptide-binding protein [Elusimicrobia bacterium]|nr:peptide-binding protein [Elusimicrobiota bacterium]
MKLKKFVLIMFCAIALFSCDKQNENIVNVADEDSQDMYVMSSIGDAIYLNPILASDSASSSVNAYIYNGLLKYDKNLNLICDLAESYNVSENGLEIKFKLKKNILWHDGQKFTVKDVKFTFDKLTDTNTRTPFSSDYLMVKEFKIIDDYSFSVTYEQPFAPILESWCIGIIPEHIYKNEDINTSQYNRNPVGTGPYKFKKWVTDQKIVLEANPDYYEGTPKIKACLFRVIPDQSVQFLELRTETIDELSLTPDQWNAYDTFFKSYTKYRYPAFSFTFLGFNLEKEPYSDIKFRQAINFAIDKKDIITGVLSGMAKSAQGIFPPQSWAYKEIEPYEYNPQKALELLNSIGFDKSSNGTLLYKGRNFEMTIITNQGNKTRELTAQIIQEQLKKIGLQVNIRILEWSTFLNQYVNKKNFDALILGWNTAIDPDQFSLWHSSQCQPGQYNFMSYKNKDVDKLLIKARTTFNKEKRKEYYYKIQDIMREDPPCIFLYYPENLVCVHKRFQNVELAPAGIGWNFYEWFVNDRDIKYKNAKILVQ